LSPPTTEDAVAEHGLRGVEASAEERDCRVIPSTEKCYYYGTCSRWAPKTRLSPWASPRGT